VEAAGYLPVICLAGPSVPGPSFVTESGQGEDLVRWEHSGLSRRRTNLQEVEPKEAGEWSGAVTASPHTTPAKPPTRQP